MCIMRNEGYNTWVSYSHDMATEMCKSGACADIVQAGFAERLRVMESD